MWGRRINGCWQGANSNVKGIIYLKMVDPGEEMTANWNWGLQPQWGDGEQSLLCEPHYAKCPMFELQVPAQYKA